MKKAMLTIAVLILMLALGATVFAVGPSAAAARSTPAARTARTNASALSAYEAHFSPTVAERSFLTNSETQAVVAAGGSGAATACIQMTWSAPGLASSSHPLPAVIESLTRARPSAR